MVAVKDSPVQQSSSRNGTVIGNTISIAFEKSDAESSSTSVIVERIAVN